MEELMQPGDLGSSEFRGAHLWVHATLRLRDQPTCKLSELSLKGHGVGTKALSYDKYLREICKTDQQDDRTQNMQDIAY